MMKVNYYGEVLKLNKVNDDLWISNVMKVLGITVITL